MSDCPCETLWTKNPLALLGTNLLTSNTCESTNINAFTRALILAILLAVLLWPYLGSVGLVLVLLPLIFLQSRWLQAKIDSNGATADIMAKAPSKTEEGFESGSEGAWIRKDLKPAPAFPPIYTSPGVAVLTRPSAQNPFMNVLLDEIKQNPTRPPAEPVSGLENKVLLDDQFRVQWTSDPTDVFGKTQSQRQFQTMPSTSIPNDQGSFQNWLQLIPGKTCKEGGRDACYAGTNGGPVTWLNDPN